MKSLSLEIPASHELSAMSVHPRPAKAGFPRPPFDKLRVNGGHEVVALRAFIAFHAEPVEASFSLSPLAFRLYPLALIHEPVASLQPSNLPRF